jgi:hypothetical protein
LDLMNCLKCLSRGFHKASFFSLLSLGTVIDVLREEAQGDTLDLES